MRRGIIWSIVGDLEFFSSEFQFPTAMSNYPCAYCWASNFFGDNEAPFTDFRSGEELLVILGWIAPALLAQTIHFLAMLCRTEAAWRATQEMPEVEHPLMTVSGVTPDTIKLDLLHLVDLGIAAHLYGNLIWDLLEDHTGGSSRQSKLAVVNNQIANAYKSCQMPAGKRLQRLNLSDICAGGDDYPMLRHCKGRRIRHFSTVAIELASHHTGTAWGQKRMQAVKAMDAVYALADLPTSSCSAAEFLKFKKACESLLGNYGWLAKQAMKQKLCRYSITQKHHMFACRYIEQCRKLTPRMTWCYGPESFMSMCIQIGAASVKGTSAAKLPGKVIEKFRFSYHMLLGGFLDLCEED